MPNKKVTFLIVPENNSKVKQVKFSRGFIGFVICFFLLGLAGISFIVRDYLALRNTLPFTDVLKREITNQRAQIQAFAKRIRTLNSQVTALHGFEKRLRVIANVEAPEGQDAIFGIGGTMAKDLQGPPALSESHNELIRAMHAQLEQLDEASVIQEKAFRELRDSLQSQKNRLACTPAIWPTKGWLSSGFGYRKSPFTGLKEFHEGIDIATRRGTSVIATADGVVAFAGRKGSLGKTIVINHGYGKVTRYGHLSKPLVRPGAQIKRGDKIGLVGNTGRSTAPHLHYEVRLNGIPVNPTKYILN